MAGSRHDLLARHRPDGWLAFLLLACSPANRTENRMKNLKSKSLVLKSVLGVGAPVLWGSAMALLSILPAVGTALGKPAHGRRSQREAGQIAAGRTGQDHAQARQHRHRPNHLAR